MKSNEACYEICMERGQASPPLQGRNITLMEKYKELKSKHPKALLLLNVGDFYMTYDKDAVECSFILGITLTKWHADGTYQAGFPSHALDMYLPKLVRAGHRIVIY